MTQLFDLKGKVVVVVGGSKGMGQAMSRQLATCGATVVVVSRDPVVNAEVVKALQTEGLNACGIPGDLSDLEGMNRLLHAVADRYGKIDVLVNNAAVARRQPLFDVTTDDFDFLVNTNLRGSFFCSLNCARIMKQQGGGKLITTLSTLSFVGQKERGVYTMCKAGMRGMVTAMALEFADFGITSNAIAPGLTRTELNRAHFEAHPEELAEMVRHIPLGRPACPNDMAGAVVFLASDASAYINGAVLTIDGGMLCA